MLPSPNHVHRRPRPPSLAHKGRHARTPSSRSVDIPTIHLSGSMDPTTSLPETHLEEDELEVSIELDSPPPQTSKSESHVPIGLGLPSSFMKRPISPKILQCKDGHEASPPPSYTNLAGQVGSETSAVNTPPTQDVEHPTLSLSPSRDIVELMLSPGQERISQDQRGAEAANAAGRIDCSSDGRPSPDDRPASGDSDVRQRLQEVQHQLELRNNEINMAATIADKILHRHEELLAALPPDIRAVIPRLSDFQLGLDPHAMASSSSSGSRSCETSGTSSESQSIRSPEQKTTLPTSRNFTFGTTPRLNDDLSLPAVEDPSGNKRFFRTFRKGDTSLPFPHHHHPTRSTHKPIDVAATRRDSFSEVQQQEAEERLARLEQDLADARESENAQRKVAARLRRDFEKLQRDYDRAEGAAEQERVSQSISSLGSISLGAFNTPARRAADGASRPRSEQIERIEEEVDHMTNDNPGLGWGSITFPQFPSEAGPSTWRSSRKPGDSPSVESPYTRLPPLRPTEMHRRRVAAAARARAAAEARASETEALEKRDSTPLRPQLRPPSTYKRRRASTTSSSASVPQASRASSPITPTRRIRASAPSPSSVLSKLASKVSTMREYVAGSLRAGEVSRPLSQELIDAHDGRFSSHSSNGSSSSTRDRSGSGTAELRTRAARPTRPSAADLFAAPIAGSSTISDTAPASEATRTRSIKWADEKSVPRRRNTASPMTFARQIAPERLARPSPQQEGESSRTPTRTPKTSGTPGSSRAKRTTQTQHHPYLRPLRLPLKQGLEPLVPILENAGRPARPSLKSRPASDTFAVLALAHRRKFSSPGRELAVQIEHRRREQRQSRMSMSILPPLEEHSSFVTIPARLINDVIILLGLIMEWLEICLAIAYRIVSEASQGRRPNGGQRYWTGRKRYYL